MNGGDFREPRESIPNSNSYGYTDVKSHKGVDPKSKGGISTPANYYFSKSTYNIKPVEALPADKVFPGLYKLNNLDTPNSNGAGVIKVTVPENLIIKTQSQ